MSLKKYKISIKEIIKIIELNYNIKGSVEKLDGEIDFNYKIQSSNANNYLLKISRPNFDKDYIDYQIKLLDHLNTNCKIELAFNISTVDNKKFCVFKDSFGNDRCVRLISWIDGRLWSSVNPIEESLRRQLGVKSAILSNSLNNFNHSFSKRKIDWDISNCLWVEEHIEKFDINKREIVLNIIKSFKNNHPIYKKLKKSIIHNDINDNNIIVSNDLLKPTINSIIDFGDSVFSQTINDLAITCSYGIMNVNDPLAACCEIINGNNSISIISDEELKLLYNLIAVRLVISVTKSLINKIEEPENEYLLISEKPAWNLLKKWSKINSEYAYYSFRRACNLDAHQNKNKFTKWTKNKKFSITELFPEINKNKFSSTKILKLLANKNSLFETALVTANDEFVNLFLKNRISYDSILPNIFKLLNDNEIKKLKKILPTNISQVINTSINIRKKINLMKIR